jgi:hypothetical protein
LGREIVAYRSTDDCQRGDVSWIFAWSSSMCPGPATAKLLNPYMRAQLLFLIVVSDVDGSCRVGNPGNMKTEGIDHDASYISSHNALISMQYEKLAFAGSQHSDSNKRL